MAGSADVENIHTRNVRIAIHNVLIEALVVYPVALAKVQIRDALMNLLQMDMNPLKVLYAAGRALRGKRRKSWLCRRGKSCANEIARCAKRSVARREGTARLLRLMRRRAA